MTLPTVEILLATYNGARFLRQQVESLLAQDYPALRILASDDGSADATAAILAGYAAAHSDRFRVLASAPPTGSAQANFLRLMQHADSPYVAFSDQDDVWLPTKISDSLRAMQQLQQQHGAGKPLLVFTDLAVVDRDLHTLHPSMWAQTGIDPTAALRLNRLVARAVVTGCTMLINQPLLALARQMPPAATMHDRWIALLAASLGATAYLPSPLVLYRQHDANVIGAVAQDRSPAGLFRRLTNSEKRLQQRRLNESQIEAVLHQQGSAMPPANAALLAAYLESSRSPSAAKRIALTLSHGFYRQGLLANLALLLEPFRSN